MRQFWSIISGHLRTASIKLIRSALLWSENITVTCNSYAPVFWNANGENHGTQLFSCDGHPQIGCSSVQENDTCEYLFNFCFWVQLILFKLSCSTIHPQPSSRTDLLLNLANPELVTVGNSVPDLNIYNDFSAQIGGISKCAWCGRKLRYVTRQKTMRRWRRSVFTSSKGRTLHWSILTNQIC